MRTHLRVSLARTACGEDATRVITEADSSKVDCRHCLKAKARSNPHYA